MKENDFYAMLSRMKYINRWGLMRNTINENINEHSLDVAFIAHALGVINNTQFGGSIDAERLAVLGMFHDVTEIITGDMPTPVKYYSPVIRNAYREVEKVAMDELLSGLPESMRAAYAPLMLENPEEELLWKYVKAADKLSALIKCMEEKKMGNVDFDDAYAAIFLAVTHMASEIPEVNFFVGNFLPSYDQTLDELKSEKN